MRLVLSFSGSMIVYSTTRSCWLLVQQLQFFTAQYLTSSPTQWSKIDRFLLWSHSVTRSRTIFLPASTTTTWLISVLSTQLSFKKKNRKILPLESTKFSLLPIVVSQVQKHTLLVADSRPTLALPSGFTVFSSAVKNFIAFSIPTTACSASVRAAMAHSPYFKTQKFFCPTITSTSVADWILSPTDTEATKPVNADNKH